MLIKEKIIKQAVAILGSTNYVINSGNKLDNAERICSIFIESAIEEVFLSITWHKGVKLIPKTLGRVDEFVPVTINITSSDDMNNTKTIEDGCLKVIGITPSNVEWYVDNGKIYFKGKELSSGFYYSDQLLKQLKANMEVEIPSIFITLCSLYLASNVAHSLYSDSVFTDGMKKQYLQKIEETKKLHFFDYHLINSARFG